MKTNYCKIDFEASIGGLEISSEASIDFKYDYDKGSYLDPPHESLEVTKTDIIESVYHLDGEEVSEIEAYKYYDDYVKVKFEEVLPVKLIDFLEVHLDIVAEELALNSLTDN
jgi:hypothetical protein